jgi:hypothetical protein
MVDFTGENIGSYTCGIEKKKSNRFEDRPYFETKLYKCKKGNRVLNENIDKIKFPFYCTFEKRNVFTQYVEIRIGEVFYHHVDMPIPQGGINYKLYDITEQTNKENLVASTNSLDGMIENFNINIVKGKLLLFQK